MEKHEITVIWYDESGIFVFKDKYLKVCQTLEEPWLLLSEILGSYPWHRELLESYALVVFEDEKSRLYTPEIIKKRHELQAFRVQATAYAREPL